jgi:hypothetical protein
MIICTSLSSFPGEPLFPHLKRGGVTERVIGFFIGFIHRVRGKWCFTFHVRWGFTFNEAALPV